MSNQQWNQPQGGEWPQQKPEGTPPQGQPSAEQPAQQEWGQARQEWGQQQDWTQQGQTSASEWGQPVGQPSAPQGNEWAQPQPSAGDWQQAQPQPSAGDWHQAQPQPSAGDWQQAQPQGGEWGQQGHGAQEWGQQQWPAQQGWENSQQWDQNQQWSQQGQAPGGAGPAGAPQQWTQQPKKPSPFDFSVKQQVLPGAAGTIFTMGAIGIGVWWVVQLLEGLVLLVDYPLGFFTRVLGGAGLALFAVMVLRVLVEVGVSLTSKEAAEEPKEGDAPAEDPAP